MNNILNFPFGELWEREVLYAAGCHSFITIRISNDNKAPYIVRPFIEYYRSYMFNDGGRDHIPITHTGTFVFVGREWMRSHLSEEAIASFIAQRIFNPNIGR